MGNVAVTPYINFGGKAREAFALYQAALGGEVTLLAANPGGAPQPAGPNDSIMHGTLALDGKTILMGTDGMADYPATVGDNFAVALSGSDRDALTKAFNELSAGGNVKQALKDESWGDTFGWFEDQFGINWMINITKA